MAEQFSSPRGGHQGHPDTERELGLLASATPEGASSQEESGLLSEERATPAAYSPEVRVDETSLEPEYGGPVDSGSGRGGSTHSPGLSQSATGPDVVASLRMGSTSASPGQAASTPGLDARAGQSPTQPIVGSASASTGQAASTPGLDVFGRGQLEGTPPDPDRDDAQSVERLSAFLASPQQSQDTSTGPTQAAALQQLTAMMSTMLERVQRIEERSEGRSSSQSAVMAADWGEGPGLRIGQ